ncbi:MAG: O-methyltransferase [Flavobacteriales bacterium]
MNQWHEAKHFIRHLFLARNRHGVHSPLVYKLNTQVLTRTIHFTEFEQIESARKDLLADKRSIEVEDFGAGSRAESRGLRTVCSIAKNALAPAHQAQALFKLIRHFQPTSILELGTSLGITTSYLAKAAPEAQISTIEGSSNIAQLAQATFQKLNISHIDSVIGTFDEVLDHVLNKRTSWDMIYIDGNHRFEATVRYLDKIKPFLNENSIVVLDDIYWSKEMTQAWQQACQREEFSLFLDYFHFGILFCRPRMQREYHKVRY